MKTVYDVSLLDIAPGTLSQDENFSPVMKALDPALQRLAQDTKHAGLLWRIDDLDDKTLDLLMWQFHADFPDLAQTHSMKVNSVQSALTWHSKKGTAKAIIDALKLIDIDAEFVPWWISGDQPYTFRLKTVIAGDFYRTTGKDRLMECILRAVNSAKSARSYMLGIETNMRFKADAELWAGGIRAITGTIIIPMSKPVPPDSIPLTCGTVSLMSGNIIIPNALPDVPEGRIWAGVIRVCSYDIFMGVDYETMQSLLFSFENRIFSRIDNLEEAFNEKFSAGLDQLSLRLDTIENMLRWKGDDFI